MSDEVKKSAKSSDRYLHVKYDWIEQTGNAIDAIVLAYIAGWENARERATVKLKIRTIADALQLGIDQTQSSLRRLEKLGMIAKRKSIHCYIYTTRKDVMDSLKKQAPGKKKASSIEPKNSPIIEPKNSPISDGKTAQYRTEKPPDNYYDFSFNNSLLEPALPTVGQAGPNDQLTGIEESEPGASQPARPLDGSSEPGGKPPDPFAAAASAKAMIADGPKPVRDKRSPAVLKLTPEQTGLVMQIFGPNGQERKLAELVTDEQAATPGFIDFVLAEVLEVRNSGKLRKPAGMLKHVIDENWCPGWVDPRTIPVQPKQPERIVVPSKFGTGNRVRMPDGTWKDEARPPENGSHLNCHQIFEEQGRRAMAQAAAEEADRRARYGKPSGENRSSVEAAQVRQKERAEAERKRAEDEKRRLIEACKARRFNELISAWTQRRTTELRSTMPSGVLEKIRAERPDAEDRARRQVEAEFAANTETKLN